MASFSGFSGKLKIQMLFAICLGLTVIVILMKEKREPSLETVQNMDTIEPKTSTQPLPPPQETECIPREKTLGKDEEYLIKKLQYNVAFKLTNVKDQKTLVKRFRNFVISICNHSTVSLTFHLLMDDFARKVTKDVFDGARSVCKCAFKMEYYDIEYFLDKEKETIDAVRQATQNPIGMRRQRFFYLPIVLHRFLPSSLDRIILFDSDLFFQSDIKQLFAHFDSFSDETCFGGAHVQQPTYRYVCRDYRASHPDTKLGSPPPDGVPGFNGGLVMLHLRNLRNSKLYNSILKENQIKKYAEKYQFKGSRAEQDFFILLDMEHHDMFHVLPCSWNRQTIYYLGDPSYASVYHLYHECLGPIYVYHGNSGTAMPNE